MSDETKSTSMSEVLNKEMEVELGGKSYKLSKLSIEELFAEFEKDVRTEALASAQTIAATLKGEEKVQFLKEVWKDLPSGQELSDMVSNRMGTLQGIRKMLYLSIRKNDPAFTADKVVGIVDSTESLDELSPVVQYICGFGLDDEEGEKSSGEKKKRRS